MTKTKPPGGYFNATNMLLLVRPSKGIRVSQFLDNKIIQATVITLKHKPITVTGCQGYTFLPYELLEEYEKWLKNVGCKLNKEQHG